MRRITLTNRLIAWLAAGAGLITLAGGWWLLNGSEGSRPPWSIILSTGDAAGTEQAMETDGKRSGMRQPGGPSQAYAIVMPVKQQLIGVKTAAVEKRPLDTVVRAVGRVTYDEQRIARVTVRVSGWIEHLFVDYTGRRVRKGDPLFTLYSPDLVATQEEYLLALRALKKVQESPIPEVRQQAQQMVEAARERLELWTLTDDQIDELTRRGKALTSVTIFSPLEGHVIEKNVFKGTFVQPELSLYTISDLSVIWVNAEIYEYEVPFVHLGQPATVTVSSYPGDRFEGLVSFLYPYLNKETRTVKVRLALPNQDGRLKPEMYGNVVIKVARGAVLAIPEEAVVDSGVRTIAFVVRGEGLFEPREITLGPKVGSFYEVHDGLAEGDRVVISGNFLIDSESKLMAATNMMGALGMGGIRMEQARMGQMDMGGMEMRTQEATPAARAKLEKRAGGLTVALSTEPTPPRTGDNLIRVQVTETGGTPVSDATVRLAYTMPMPGMIPTTVPMKPGKAGLYEARANLGMGGRWDLTITIRRAGGAEIKETFSVTVGAGDRMDMPGL